MTPINLADYKILIVDDNPTNVVLAKAIVKRKGYQITTATSGREALEKVQTSKPDLILLDVMMPGMNGFEVAQKIKENPDTKDIIIVFLTALDEIKGEVDGFKHGGDDYIHKPIQSDILLARILYQIKQIHAMRTIVEQQKKLEIAIKSRDNMYSIISHDLRSPLATLKMIHNMLLVAIPEDSIDKDMYDLLVNANKLTDDVFNLLDNLLKWTKTQLNRLNIVFQDVNMSDLVLSVIETYRHIAAEKGVEIDVECESDQVEILGDIDLLKTVLRNLLSNAIKFSKDGGKISVSITQDDENAILHVRDWGTGIKPEDQDKILSDTSFTSYGTKGEEGTGLGLSLCKDFVNKNNGKFWFESVYGEGTTFSFSIPLKTTN